ncbi:unnamed protein product [Lota lota]
MLHVWYLEMVPNPFHLPLAGFCHPSQRSAAISCDRPPVLVFDSGCLSDRQNTGDVSPSVPCSPDNGALSTVLSACRSSSRALGQTAQHAVLR